MTIRLKGPALTALRRNVLVRDGWRCQRCGVSISDALPDWHPRKAHMRHILGRGAGGSDTEENCEASCMSCHSVEEHAGGSKIIRRK
jgi:5-methylcytosine-specific restriction endonuclease McrA